MIEFFLRSRVGKALSIAVGLFLSYLVLFRHGVSVGRDRQKEDFEDADQERSKGIEKDVDEVYRNFNGDYDPVERLRHHGRLRD